MSWTSTPASISSAAMRWESGPVFSYMNLTGVGHQRRRRAPSRSSGVISAPEQPRERGRGSRRCTRRACRRGSRSRSACCRGGGRCSESSRRRGAGSRRACGRCSRSRGRPPTRSTRSTGGSWNTSSSGRKRYSTGSGNSFAARNITESLPSCWSSLCVASSEPSASPSGPSWVVSRNRSAARISSATSASVASVRCATAAGASLILEQPRDPHAPLRRLVVVEGQRRGALDPHLACDGRLQHAM